MRNIALKLRYDGSAYHGWQVQKFDVSVAATVEKALSKVCGHPVRVTGCGRTDAGVHALNYCANFRTESRIPVDRLPLAVNTRLPDDIAVLAAIEVPDDFNAILSCVKKEYVYRIMNTRIRDPFLQKRVCFYPAPLDIERMKAAGRAFEGTHDFAAVRSVGTQTKTTVRTSPLVPRRTRGRRDNRRRVRGRLSVQHGARHRGHHGLRLARQAGAGGDTRPAGKGRPASHGSDDAAAGAVSQQGLV